MSHTDWFFMVSGFVLGAALATGLWCYLLARKEDHLSEAMSEIDRLRARLGLKSTDPS